jgi:hypothetical protein
MRLFFIKFGNYSKICKESSFKSFIEVAVLHNKDIHSFKCVEICSRLTEEEGLEIAQRGGFAPLYYIETQNGMTPFESVISHIKIK